MEQAQQQRIAKLRDEIVELVRTHMQEWEGAGLDIRFGLPGAMTALAHGAAITTIRLTGPDRCRPACTLLISLINHFVDQITNMQRGRV